MDIFNAALAGLFLGGLILLVGLLAISNYRKQMRLWDAQQQIDDLTQQRENAFQEAVAWATDLATIRALAETGPEHKR